MLFYFFLLNELPRSVEFLALSLMRITTKFIGSSALLIGLSALLSGSSYLINRQVGQSLNASYHQAQVTSTAVVQLEFALQDQITALSRLSVLSDVVEERDTYQRSRQQFFQALDELEAVFPVADQPSRLRLDSIRRQHVFLEEVFDQLQTTQTSDVEAKEIARSLRLFDQQSGTYIRALLKSANQQTEAFGKNQQVLYARTAGLEVIRFGSIFLLLAAQFHYLFRPVMRALHRLEAGADQIGQLEIGRIDDAGAVSEMPQIHLNTGDELQALADAFNQMGDRLTALYRELEQRVVARTASLNRVNQDLLEEVRDRTQAEAKLQQAQLQLLQAEKMSSLSQLVAGVAHEINNPVSFIQGNLEPAQAYVTNLLALLRRYEAEYPEASDELRAAIEQADLDFIRKDFPQLLQSMKTGAERITTIVRSLRTFSHLDESETKATDLHEDLDSVLLLLAPQMNGHSAGGSVDNSVGNPRRSIKTIRHYGKLPKVYCYPSQLNQVFMGLLTNAIEALAANDAIEAPTITVVTEALDDSVRIQIVDNGIGMSDRVLSHLFEPFFTTKTVGVGMGLDLAMSYQIVVSNHKGKLTCASEMGQGTTFTIEIPLALKLQSSWKNKSSAKDKSRRYDAAIATGCAKNKHAADF